MKKLIGYITLLICCTGCFEIPEEGTISNHFGFTQTSTNIILKTQQIIGSDYGLRLSTGETTFPFQLSVEKIVRLDEKGKRGEDVTKLFSRTIKVKQWKQQYTKDEKTREEFEAKRTEAEVPVLSFTKANELLFHYGYDDIEPGLYMLDIRVTNSSGFKIFENSLKLNVKEAAPYMLSDITHLGGMDGTRTCSVLFEKKGSDRENLTVRVQEKSGEIVPLDSIFWPSASYSFDNVFHFSQEHTKTGTTIDIPFPIPYNPGSLSSPLNIYRGVNLEGVRYGRYPQSDGSSKRQVRYGFNFRFLLNEPGDWLMTIKFE